MLCSADARNVVLAQGISDFEFHEQSNQQLHLFGVFGLEYHGSDHAGCVNGGDNVVAPFVFQKNVDFVRLEVIHRVLREVLIGGFLFEWVGFDVMLVSPEEIDPVQQFFLRI